MTNKTEGALKKRVLSGIQPTGEVHLGNYLGALRQWVDMQQEYDCFYSIVDQHAILGSGDPTTLPGRTVEMAISLLSVGLDPEKCTIFVQSDVPEHIELSWLFNVIAPVGDLERMTQYKDKSARYDSIPAGLLNYPILQAADILIYRAEAVPVGEDQKQHLELTRDIARKWNARYGDLFPIPEAIVPNTGRIKGLDGNKKMSKSLDNTVGVFFEEEEHEYFSRYRDDILLQVRINFTQAVFGDKINVPTVDGKASLKIPSGIEAGQILRIKGKGFPRLRRSGRGDQLVKIQINVPKKISGNEKTILKEYQKINKDKDVSFEKFDD